MKDYLKVILESLIYPAILVVGYLVVLGVFIGTFQLLSLVHVYGDWDLASVILVYGGGLFIIVVGFFAIKEFVQYVRREVRHKRYIEGQRNAEH